jgi:hypothetical protein
LLQRIKQCGTIRCDIFFLQSAEHTIQDGQSPLALVNHFGSQWICWFQVDPIVSAEFFQRDRPLTLPPLDRHRPALLVGEKIFQSPKQKGTKPSLFLAHGAQTSALQ